MNPIILCGILKLKIKNFCHFISKNPVKYNIIRIKKNSLFFFRTKFCYIERSRFYHAHIHTYIHSRMSFIFISRKRINRKNMHW